VSSPLGAESWAHYSADGQWVYFSGATTTTYWLYRVHPDGTGLTMLGTNPGDGSQRWKPSPSPDGTKLAFTDGASVAVLDLATLTSSTWSVPGFTPRWSPTGSPIAIMPAYPNQQVTAVNPDGTNDHVISPPNEYYGTQEYEQAFDWSPDGQWLILRNDNKYQLEVVQVATGLELPLAWGFAVGGPAWHAP
jgi:Tol biopolymer transport system component